jgi:hypothetical protein
LDGSNLIIIGDLNQLPTSDLESTLNLQQRVKVPTRGNSTLDKILIEQTICECFDDPTVEPNFGTADHLLVSLKPVKQNRSSSSVRIKKVFDYRDSNIAAFVNVLKHQPWHLLYRSEDPIDVKCDLFYDLLRPALDRIPFTYIEITDKDKPWMTPLLKLLINRRYDAYRQGHYDKYNHFKNKVRVEVLKAKSAWLQRLKQKPYGIWKAVKSVSTKPVSTHGLANQFPSASGVADALNSAFSSVFTSPNSHADQSDERMFSTNGEAWIVEITVERTSKLLRNLKSGKAAGSDNLTPRLLRACHRVLAGPLTHLFVCSISSRQVPSRWKQAIVTPIPKITNPSVTDFRPISLLPIPSKILEFLVLDSIKPKLLNLYGDNQFGFRPGSSTLDAHLAIHDHITRELDHLEVKGVALIAMDLSKAFDRLSHASLIQTLSDPDACIPSSFLLWLRDFLKNRSQRVSFEGTMSTNSVKVTSGVPQGSILAPYLFAAHMGGLMAATSSTRIIKYADDVALLIPYSNYSDLAATVSNEIQNVKTWCETHSLALNESKTKTLLFPKGNPNSLLTQGLPDVEPHLSSLGIIFETSLKWNKHVESITKKASGRIYALKSLKRIPTVTKRDLLQVYCNYILSLLEYNSPLLVGMSTRNDAKLDRIRKRCHRIICGLDCKCNDFSPIGERRLSRAMKVFESLMSTSNISHPLLPRRLPRTQHFYMEPMRTTRRMRSFIPFCAMIWNASH